MVPAIVKNIGIYEGGLNILCGRMTNDYNETVRAVLEMIVERRRIDRVFYKHS